MYEMIKIYMLALRVNYLHDLDAAEWHSGQSWF